MAVDYRAPELLHGRRNCTAVADAWAIACSMGKVARQSGLFDVTLDGAARLEKRDSAEVSEGTAMVHGQIAVLGFPSVQCLLSLRAPIASSDTPALPVTGLDTVIRSYYELDGVELLRALLQ